MTQLFVEVGVEEIPARMMESALDHLDDRFDDWLEEKRLVPDSGDPELTVQGTPRRLVVTASARDHQRTRTNRIKGPPEHVAYDDGEPTQALNGFMAQHDLQQDDVNVTEVDGGRYVMAEVEESGESIRTCLKQDLEELVLGMDWPKSMRWDRSNVDFVRPIRWLVVMLDDEPVEVTLGPVDAGQTSRGLRFTDQERFDVASLEDYRSTLSDQGLIVDQDERRETIRRQVDEVCESIEAEPRLDADLLEELTHLNEAPRAFLGSFDESFLEVPDVVLRKAMVSHQKYVPVEDEVGSLQPYFVGVRNGAETGLEVVREGNEKVIRARLADAEFFYEKDRQRSFEDYREELKGVVFQEELGSLFDKTERLASVLEQLQSEHESLPGWLSNRARHVKNDLVTDLVEEFPGLQGTVGRIYAEESGWPDEAARVVEAHHHPEDRGDSPPDDTPSAWLGLIDRLDTLLGFFGVGERPTGSSDPYGLRRDAVSVLRIIQQHEFPVQLPSLLKTVSQAAGGEIASQSVRRDLMEFFEGRFQQLRRREGVPAHLVEAGTDLTRWPVRDCFRRVEWLRSNQDREDLATVIEAAGRVRNIVRDQDVAAEDFRQQDLDQPATRTLYESLEELSVSDRLAWNLDDALIEETLEQFLVLSASVHEFFEEIMVMAEDEDLRRNRLALLAQLDQIYQQLFNFAELEPLT